MPSLSLAWLTLIAVAAGWVASPSARPVDLPDGLAIDAAQARVLVLHQFRRDTPISAAMEDIYRETLARGLGPRLDYYSEYLDAYRFERPEDREALRRYLKERYRDIPFDVVIATTTAMLAFIRSPDDDTGVLFPHASVVFHGGAGLTGGPRSTGVVSQVDTTATLRIALALHPSVKQVVVVSGVSRIDRNYGDLARRQFEAFADRLSFTYWEGLTPSELEERARGLSADTIVYYVVVSQDRLGGRLIPVEVLARLSAASSRPVYGIHEEGVGHGAVGGRVFSSRTVARETAALALRILSGEAAESIPVRQIDPYVTVFDGRQLARWGIDERLLPTSSEIRFRPVGVWQQYRERWFWVAAGLGLATLFAAGIWAERRHRDRLERQARTYVDTLADLDRRATVSHLSATLTHELSQPLSAIRANSQAAAHLLQSAAPDLDELRVILREIREDDQRASEIVRRARGLTEKRTFAAEPVDLNEVAREAVDLVASLTTEQQVRVEIELAPAPLVVVGDPVQLRQVLLNLLLNSIEAMNGVPADARVVRVATIAQDGAGEVIVEDRGVGIAQPASDDIFSPFVTTKPGGLGLGLFLCRSIVEMHGGQIVATNNENGVGAAVRVSLRSGEAPAIQASQAAASR